MLARASSSLPRAGSALRAARRPAGRGVVQQRRRCNPVAFVRRPVTTAAVVAQEHGQRDVSAPQSPSAQPCADADGAGDLAAIKQRAHATLKVDMPSVVKALHDDTQGSARQACPFLHRVSDTITHDEALQGTLTAGGPSAARAMTNIINDSLWGVLRDLKDKGQYREFRYFRRVVGQHPVYQLTADDTPGTSDAPDAARPSAAVDEAARPQGQPCPQLRALPAQPQQPPPRDEINAMPAVDDLTVVNWCSNDYLNMSHQPVVMDAMIQTIREQGTGSGGTRNISGSNVLHVELERELAGLCGTQDALLFNSCYSANLGILQALGKALPKGAIVFSDGENHASLVQGIRFSGLEKRIFRHNDLAHLRQLLSEAPADVPKIVVFESVYSMSGTMAPVSQILDVCDEFDAFSLIDEVHACGLYGDSAGGVLDEIGQLGRATAVTGTLGKAFGISGGWVAGSEQLVDVVRSLAPSFIFTTSLPPATAAGGLASVKFVRSRVEGAAERRAMREMARSIGAELLRRGVPLTSTETHILPIHVGDPDVCRAISNELLERGIYVQPINFPSVPVGEDMLRFTVSPKHTDGQCEHMIDELTAAMARHGLLAAVTQCPHTDRHP